MYRLGRVQVGLYEAPDCHGDASRPTQNCLAGQWESGRPGFHTRRLYACNGWRLWKAALQTASGSGGQPLDSRRAKSRGIDIRAHGSGNIGATNVLRVMGKKFGIPCLLLDMLKGFIPVAIAVNLIQITGRRCRCRSGLPETGS